MKTLIVFIVGVTLFFLYAHSKRQEADERAHVDLQRQLQVSEITPDVLRNNFVQLDAALHNAIAPTPYGIVFKPQYSGTTIVSLNTPYQIECNHTMGITITFASSTSDSPDAFRFHDYQKSLPFLAESVAGEKLIGLLCMRTAAYMQTLQNSNNP